MALFGVNCSNVLSRIVFQIKNRDIYALSRKGGYCTQTADPNIPMNSSRKAMYWNTYKTSNQTLQLYQSKRVNEDIRTNLKKWVKNAHTLQVSQYMDIQLLISTLIFRKNREPKR